MKMLMVLVMLVSGLIDNKSLGAIIHINQRNIRLIDAVSLHRRLSLLVACVLGGLVELGMGMMMMMVWMRMMMMWMRMVAR